MDRRIPIACCIVLSIFSIMWIRHSSIFEIKNNGCCPPTIYSSRNSSVSQRGFNFDPIEKIRADCGELCNTSRTGTPGKYFDQIKASINCKALFQNEYIDKGHELPHAPKEIPPELLKDFTMNNRLSVRPWYFDQRYFGTNSMLPLWTKQNVDDWVSLARQGSLKGNYGVGDTNDLRDGLKNAPKIKNGRVMVIGSENPWVEACVLEAGAREVVTLEYGRIISQHPQVKTLVPYDFRMSYLNNTLGSFDAIVTFSSLEHSGLGRYGDALNPWGDIITIARAWCVTKPGGSLTIGIPYVYSGNDYIAFNAARYYGKIRYPYIATNWQQVYRGERGQHRVHVFSKEE